MMAAKPKILFVIHSGTPSGATLALYHLLRNECDHTKHSYYFWFLDGGSFVDSFASLGRVVYIQSSPTWGKIRLQMAHHFRWLRKKFAILLLHCIKIDAILANTVTCFKDASFLSKHHTIPVTYYLHEGPLAISTYHGIESFRNLLPLAKSLVVVSSLQLKQLKAYIPPQLSISVIPPKIPNYTNPAQNSIPFHSTLSQNTILIGCVGHISWIKGADIFLNVAFILSKMKLSHPWIFQWAGRVSEIERIQLMHDIDRMNLNSHVQFLGELTNPESFYSACDIYLCPSREESYSLSILESAAKGKPIICFENTCGAQFLVKDGGGILVPYMDLFEMANAVKSLIESKEVRDEMGRMALKNYMLNLSESNSDFQHILDTMIENPHE